MNGTYFQNPTFPGAGNEPMPKPMPEMNNYQSNIVPINEGTQLPMEQSYIENILRLNRGKHAKAYISFPDSVNWKDKIFDGIVEQAGRDHLVMSNDKGNWFLIPLIYLDYVEFDEKIVYRPSELKQ